MFQKAETNEKITVQMAEGAFSDDKDKPFSSQDIRITMKGNIQYEIAFDVYAADLIISNITYFSE